MIITASTTSDLTVRHHDFLSGLSIEPDKPDGIDPVVRRSSSTKELPISADLDETSVACLNSYRPLKSQINVENTPGFDRLKLASPVIVAGNSDNSQV